MELPSRPRGQKFVRTTTGAVIFINPANTQHFQEAQQQQLVNVSAGIGQIEEFDPDVDWEINQGRLEQYLTVNHVVGERRAAVLITVIGPRVHETLRDLWFPDPPSSRLYEDLCTTLRKYFAPTFSVSKERKQFYDLHQDSSKTVNLWYARVKKGEVKCKFGEDPENRVEDKFVAGMSEGKVLERICEEEHTTSLDDIVRLARKKEATLPKATESSSVHRVYNAKLGAHVSRKGSGNSVAQAGVQTGKQQPQQQAASTPWRHCGGINHNFSICKFRDYKCNVCQVVGHLTRLCKKSDVKSNAYFVEVSDPGIDKSSESVIDIFFRTINLLHKNFTTYLSFEGFEVIDAFKGKFQVVFLCKL
ncbi:hypothetical protein QAD02_001979 [Eretmocerus hayati]|uniref:Uncharacterized protein n=1 Tax=Eretmocerus hayati TaxID=131215 RepID=A0ACC2NHN0_9HYME|nr:hypothetical protein QAD02_001979 [Eretmocerus hayati]